MSLKVVKHFSEMDSSLSLETSSQSSQQKEVNSRSFLDFHSLLEKLSEGLTIKPCYTYWYLNYAILTNSFPKDHRFKKRIDQVILHAFSKAATVDTLEAVALGAQSSPIVPQYCRYHRSSANQLLAKVYHAYAKELGLVQSEFLLVSSPLLREVLHREWPVGKKPLEVGSSASFVKIVHKLLERTKRGGFPANEDRILIDFSKYLDKKEKGIKEIKKTAAHFERLFFKHLKEFLASHPDVDEGLLVAQLLPRLHIIAFRPYKRGTVLVIPKFLDKAMDESHEEKQKAFYADLSDLLSRTGFLLGPDEAKKAWLEVESLASIMASLGLPQARLATQGSHIPVVCQSWKIFLNQPVVKKFRDLSQEEIPYLQVLSEATFRLLEGLAQAKIKGIRIDKRLDNGEYKELSQISFFRMLNAMNEAILSKHDPVAFQNQIELLQQEVQNWLAILQPYDEDALAKQIETRLKKTAIIGYEELSVHLKPSAMHSLASVVAAVERQKKSNKLHVVIARDCYYHEAGNPLTTAEAHKKYVLDPEQGDKAFQGVPPKSVDLFLCEFHHNALHHVTTYRKEDVLCHVKVLMHNKLASNQLTVVIDNTIDLEKSDDAQQFFADSEIKDWVINGKLNVVLLRSMQKFDMLGMDNYYGGLTVTVNAKASFNRFNQRMDMPEDQQRGLSYQGLTHIHTHAGSYLDRYRKAIMANTARLYRKLPPEIIYQRASRSPIQISQIQDDRVFFLDIKFPSFPQTRDAFVKRFLQLARNHKLPLTTRASFGFVHTSFTSIKVQKEDGKFETKLRLNVGLDAEETLDVYADFFRKIGSLLKLSKKDLKREDLDSYLAKRVSHYY